MTKNSNNQGIQVISRAAEILRFLGRDSGGKSLGQIAKHVNLPRSTVQRIVSALEKEGFISTGNENNTIRLGPEIQHLAYASVFEVSEKLRTVMHRISKMSGETVDLSILEGNRMLFIDQVVGTHRLRTVSSIGKSFPLTTTANGKAALACLEDSTIAELVSSELSEEYGSKKSLNEILSEIQTIRTGELALDSNEHTHGISAFGFALRDSNGEVYAISIPVPSSRFSMAKKQISDTINQVLVELDIRTPFENSSN